jgi:response regulator RpfG family c-di-GMP phosphodiesterase
MSEKNNHNGSEGQISKEIVFSEAFFNLPLEALEQYVSSEMTVLSIKKGQRSIILALLNELKDHNVKTYRHSLKVGLLCSYIARDELLNIDPKPVFVAGLMHDFGKTVIDSAVLDKKEGFTQEDYRRVQKHVQSGYGILKTEFEFISEIVARHHMYSANPYPDNVPTNSNLSNSDLERVERYGKILAIMDFYCAMHTRHDEGGKTEGDGPEARKAALKNNYPQYEKYIDYGFDKGLLH